MSDFKNRLTKRLEDPEFVKAWEEVLKEEQSMSVITDKLIDIHYDAERYKEETHRLLNELNRNKEFIESVFNRKFKVRGIHAKVDDYSLQGNWIELFSAYPDSGVDCLTLTFKEFAQQVEFVD